MKVKIRVTNDYEDLDDPIVEEKWIDAAVPGTKVIEEWADEWLERETGTGRYAGACRHCGEEVTYINAAPTGEPERLIPRHANDLPGVVNRCELPEPFERTPNAIYTVEILECEEMPFLVGQTFEWGL